VAKASLTALRACLDTWIRDSATAKHLAVHCIGRASEHAPPKGDTAGDARALWLTPLPHPGIARVVITRPKATGADAARGEEETFRWEGSEEELEMAFPDHELYPCFVSGNGD